MSESWTRKGSPFSSTFYGLVREGQTPSKLTSNRDGGGEEGQREKVELQRKEGKEGWEKSLDSAAAASAHHHRSAPG